MTATLLIHTFRLVLDTPDNWREKANGQSVVMTGLAPRIEVALVWLLWCFLHSLLISRWWMAACRSRLGERFVGGWYRVFFNGISLATLVPVLFLQFSFKQVVLFSWPGWWIGIKILLYAYALYMLYAGLRRYDLPFFVGSSQVKAYLAGAALPRPVFAVDTIGGVRHPWYSGGIALVWAYGPVTDVSLASKMVLSSYLVVGAFLEERKLLAEIGAPYAEYRHRLPMLIPRFKVKK
ncbi:MAG: hypothetical protein HY885_18025 [Deltaproteobacteria bacterium]|nr:hypothetical protein [Deltaproteobacteria bacterium]